MVQEEFVKLFIGTLGVFIYLFSQVLAEEKSVCEGA